MAAGWQLRWVGNGSWVARVAVAMDQVAAAMMVAALLETVTAAAAAAMAAEIMEASGGGWQVAAVSGGGRWAVVAHTRAARIGLLLACSRH